MKDVLKILVIIGLMVLCIALSGTAFFANKSAKLQDQIKPRTVQVIDQGVFIPLAVVQSVFGKDQQVRVHTSPQGSETAGAKTVDDKGVINVWVPTTFRGGVSSLTPSEAQEYVMRQLAACPQRECLINTADSGLDAGTLTTMASDTSVKRTEASDIMDKFVLADTFKYAIEKQAEVAQHGMDSIVKVAVSGDAAQTTSTAAMAAGMSLKDIALIAVVVGFIIFLLKATKK